MQPKEFRYKPENVFPDLHAYLFSIPDVYGTNNFPHIVDELIKDVSAALKEPWRREHLQEGNLPDRVRILLDGIGILPENEINRRWNMLQGMYRAHGGDIHVPIISISSSYY